MESRPAEPVSEPERWYEEVLVAVLVVVVVVVVAAVVVAAAVVVVVAVAVAVAVLRAVEVAVDSDEEPEERGREIVHIVHWSGWRRDGHSMGKGLARQARWRVKGRGKSLLARREVVRHMGKERRGVAPG